VLCRLADLPEGRGRGFVRGGVALLVVRRGGQVVAYENRCPHKGVSLDWVQDRFLDDAGEHIQCGTHGARFRIDDGFCIDGPCAGKSLTPVAITVRDDGMILARHAPPTITG